MTQEEKDLLKDLCARLPYKVKGHRIWVAPLSGSPEECDTELDTFDIECLSSLFDCGEAICKIDGHVRVLKRYSFKPYLRSLSSITKEEKKELLEIAVALSYNKDDIIIGTQINSFRQLDGVLDLFNSHHLDWRGLIEKGLALEAPEGMYNIKEK